MSPPGTEAAPPLTDPRRRILSAMAEVVAEHGYAAASVARALSRAGVSRAGFYECFPSREQCFAALYEERVQCLGERLRTHADTEQRPLRAALTALLESAAENPEAAALVALEAPAAAPTRERHEALLAELGSELERFLVAEGARHQAPPFALAGGIEGVLSIRLARGEGPRLGELTDELLAWIDSYALAPGAQPLGPAQWAALGRSLGYPRSSREAEAAARLLPRGRSSLGEGESAALRRKRILAATAQLVASDGYPALTVAAIVATARVSRGAFYSQFATKQDAFLAAQLAGLQGAIAATAAEFALGPQWPERVWRGLAAFLTYLAEHPNLATLGLAEAPAAGRAALRRDHDSRMAFALFLEEGYRYQQERRASSLFSEATTSAIRALALAQVRSGRLAHSLELLPHCAYVALAPFLGSERALGVVRAGGLGAP